MAEIIIANEEWRVIDEAPDYAVSDCGQVKRLTRSQKGGMSRPGRHLKHTITPAGYHAVTLCFGDARLIRFVHRLVCRAFHGEQPEGRPRVLHRNDVKADNRKANLRWGSDLENKADQRANGNVLSGEKCSFATLTKDQVLLIREDQRSGADIARSFGCSRSTVSLIKLRKIWRDLA